nr:thioesterase family protein [Acinetobacter guillouiae]
MSNLYGWLKKWKRKEDMSSVFDLRIKVKPEHIDVLGHVNNVVYVQWMQDVASAHIATMGVGLDQYLEMKHAMVAVEHHVQYRKAAMLDDDVILRTWLYEINALYSFRQYAFFNAKDNSLLFTGNTKWACIEIASGRPKRMSPTFIQAYQPIDPEIDPFDLSLIKEI